MSLVEDGDGAGVDPFLGGQVERDEVAHQDEVEELGQIPLALGPDLDDVGHDLPEELGDQLEAPDHLGVFGVVAEVDQGHDLAGDVAVLAPAGDLVVAELGIDGRRRPATWRSR